MKIKSCLVLCFVLVFSCVGLAKQKVLVGGYAFPPFVQKNKATKNFEGITFDMIRELNEFQDEYEFSFVLTSPKRRYQSFAEKKFDIIMFESIHWGWKDKGVTASNVFLKGGEVYIALVKPGRNQSFFADFKNKKMVGILGYHYGFCGFNANEKFLKKEYNMHLTNSHQGSIQLILKERDDIAVITKSFLSQYLNKNPAVKPKLLISSKLDQEYNHTILVRNDLTPDVGIINQLLDQMKKKEILKKIWEENGLSGVN